MDLLEVHHLFRLLCERSLLSNCLLSQAQKLMLKCKYLQVFHQALKMKVRANILVLAIFYNAGSTWMSSVCEPRFLCGFICLDRKHDLMVETQDWIHSIWALFLPLLLSPSVTFSKQILHATVPVEKNVTRCLLGHVWGPWPSVIFPHYYKNSGMIREKLIQMVKLTWVNKKQEPYKRAQQPPPPKPVFHCLFFKTESLKLIITSPLMETAFCKFSFARSPGRLARPCRLDLCAAYHSASNSSTTSVLG